MPKAKFEVLGLEVPTSFFTVYHDDGFVDSIKGHSLKLVDKYYLGGTAGKYPAEETKAFYDCITKRGGLVDGATMVLPTLFRDHIHIFYSDNLPPKSTVNVRAHEETHALEELGHLDMLAEKILREQKVKIDFREIGGRPREWKDYLSPKLKRLNKEIRADIGAVYALHAHGIDPDRAICIGPSFEIALDLYERARVQGE